MNDWKPLAIDGFANDFEISIHGQIRRVAGHDCAGRFRKEKLIKQYTSRSGYRFSCIAANHVKRTVLIHRALLMSFVGSPPELHFQCNHKDGNKTNNALENLEWVSPSGNHIHAIENGLKPIMERHYKAKLTRVDVLEIRDRHKNGETCLSISKDHDCTPENIDRIVKRLTWKYI